MPIKKRTSLPPPPKPKVPDKYRLPGKPLENIVKALDKKASDAAWVGDETEAARCEALALVYRARIEAGELYEVDH